MKRLRSTHFAQGPVRFHIETQAAPEGGHVAKANGIDMTGKGDRPELAIQDLKRKLHDAIQSGDL